MCTPFGWLSLGAVFKSNGKSITERTPSTWLEPQTGKEEIAIACGLPGGGRHLTHSDKRGSPVRRGTPDSWWEPPASRSRGTTCCPVLTSLPLSAGRRDCWCRITPFSSHAGLHTTARPPDQPATVPSKASATHARRTPHSVTVDEMRVALRRRRRSSGRAGDDTPRGQSASSSQVTSRQENRPARPRRGARRPGRCGDEVRPASVWVEGVFRSRNRPTLTDDRVINEAGSESLS